MDVRNIKELIDDLDFQGPLYFIDIDWKANLYRVKEMHEWKMIIHNNEEVYFGYGDNNTYQLGRTVFRSAAKAHEYLEILNKSGIEILN